MILWIFYPTQNLKGISNLTVAVNVIYGLIIYVLAKSHEKYPSKYTCSYK